MADTIALAQAAYWPQQLSSLVVQYALEGTLPTADNVLAFIPPGGSPSWQYQIPFLPTSGSGNVTVSGIDRRVPWSQMPPPAGQYTWIILLKSACGAVYAQATLQIVPPPSLLNLIYDGTSVTAQFVPVLVGSPTNYTLAVTTSAGVLTGSTADPFQTQIVIALSSSITGSPTFTLTTVGQSSLSSTSPAAPVQVDQPVVDQVSYDGAVIRARWQAVAGATQYLLRAFSSTGKQPFQLTLEQTEANLAAPGIDASYKFLLMASATPNVWASIAPLGFLLSPPQVVVAVYDNVALTAEWMVAPQATSYTMWVFSAAGPDYQAQTTVPQGRLAAPGLDPGQTYFFSVLGNATGMVSAAQGPMPLLLAFPELMAGTYDGANIVAQWRPVTGASGYTMRTFGPEGGPSYQADVSVPQGVLAAPNLSQTLPYVFAIVANQTGYVSSSTPLAPVATAIPQLTAALYNQISVQATWTPVVSGGVSGYTLRVFGTDGSSYSVTVSPALVSALLPIPAPLDAKLSYQVQLLADVPAGIAAVTQQPMLVAAPNVSRVSYDGAQVQASWTAPGSGPALTGYLLHVYGRNGGPSFDSAILPPASTSGAVSIPNPLDPSSQYAVEIIAQAGVVSSSEQPLPLITELPSILSAAYDGARASVSWVPVLGGDPPAGGYALSSFATGAGGTRNTTTLNNPMITTGSVPVASPGQLSYAVQVCATCGIVEACSPVLALVQSSPQILSVSYDGAQVRANWAATDGAPAYLLELLQAGGVESEASFTATSGSIAALLDPAQQYSVAVRAVSGVSTGPAASGNVIARMPVLTQLAYDASTHSLIVTWAALVNPPAAITGFAIGIYNKGSLVVPAVAVSGSNATSAAVTELALDGWSDYTAKVWATGTNLTGPASDAGKVIAAVPVLLAVDYDQQQVMLRWSPLPLAAVCGYLVTLTPSTGQASTVSTTESSVTLPAPSGVSYAAGVAALGSLAVGPSSQSVAVVGEQVTISSVLYDGSFLRAQWTAAQSAGATYRIELYRGSDLTSVQAASATEVNIPIELARDGDYSVKLRVIVGLASGPRSAAIKVISATPGVVSTATTATAVTVVVDTVVAAAVSGYQCYLYQGTVTVAGPVAATTVDGVTSATIPITAAAPHGYSVRVQAVGSQPTQFSGPLSAACPVLTALPLLTNASFNGASVSLTWKALPDQSVTGYVANVVRTDDNSIVASGKSPIPAAVLAFTPQAGINYVAQVQASGLIATGPFSTNLPLLVQTPGITNVSYDGARLTATASGQSAAIQFEIMSGSVALAARVSSDASVSFDIALDPAQAYALEARFLNEIPGPSVTAALVSGPPVSAAILAAAPAVSSATYDASAATLTMNWIPLAGIPAQNVTGYNLQLVQNSIVAGSANVAGVSSGTGSITGLVVNDFLTGLARVQAAGSAAAGPWSAPVSVPLAAPQRVRLILDGTSLQVSWDLIDGASGYLVSLATDQGPTKLQIHQPPAAFVVPANATSASVTVAALFGPVTGRASLPVSALFGVPSLSQATYDGGVLSLAWTAVTGAASYRISLMTGATVIAQAEFDGTSGSVVVPAGQYTAMLRALTADATGSPSPATPLIMMVPAIATAAFTAAGDCNVSWPDIGAPIYGIELASPGQQPFVDTATPNAGEVTYTIPAAKLLGGPFSFRCRARAATAPPLIAGPWSTPVELVQAIPRGLELRLHGQQLNAAWDPIEGASSYVVRASTPAGTTSEQVYEPRFSLMLANGTGTASVQVAVTFGVSTGRLSQPVNAEFATPTLKSIGCDGATLSLAWDGVDGVAGYRIAVLAGDTVQFEFDVSDTKAVVPLAPGPHGVTLRGFIVSSYGSPSAPAMPITASPTIASASFDPLSGNCTLTWPAIPSASGYDTALYQPGQQVVSDSIQQSNSPVSYTIAAAKLAGGGPFWFAARATAAGPPALTGPWNAPVLLPSLPAAGLRANYDGATISASWAPTGTAEGYRVSVVSGGTTTVLGDVAGPAANFAVASAPALDATLTVQPLGPLGPGPAALAQPLYRRGWFVTAQSPWGAAPMIAPSAAAADLILALPDLFGGVQPAGPLPANATFKVAAAAGGYTLTILGSGPAWLWDASSRAAVASDYADLTAKLETAKWTAQSRALVLEAVARSLPQTFDEALYYGFGFEPAQGWFDLRPGMVLHVEYESYQYLGPASVLPDPSQAAYLDGFVAAAVADYPVMGAGDGAGWFVTLDAALARMAAAEGIEVPAMAPQGSFFPGGAGLIDAFFDQFRQSLCRVVYPPDILGQDSTGDARRENNPVLLAASTLADLLSAANAVRNAVPLPSNVGAFYFRGRTTLSPRIRVSLDGASLLVPLGASVGDVLAEQGLRSAAPGAGLRLRRGTGPAAIPPDTPRSLEVRLDWTPSNAAWLNLPLTPGDRIESGR